ncbi:hypothetical protein [Tolypothrix sp. LEGE 11397]|uniref:hypothetical protein n=1 Tax=Tolypothrix sp. LEGE 11397 TaxID=2777971 RepID=UPI0030DA19D1
MSINVRSILNLLQGETISMENEKKIEVQELSAEELITIAGGVAVGEPYPGQYPTSDIYNDVSQEITKHLKNTKLPYWKDKYGNSHTYTSESSEG